VKVSGFAVEPQLAPGRLSAQVAWQLDVSSEVEQLPTMPPTRTISAQQSVPAPHSSAPVLPVQSRGCVGEAQVAEHVCAPDIELLQQSSPAGHWLSLVPPLLPPPVRHMGAVQTPAPVHATAHGEVVFCHAPVALQDWGCRGPPHCICPGAHEPEHVPLTHV